MASAPQGPQSQSRPVNHDRFRALRMSILCTLIAMVVSLLLTTIGVLLTGQRDWLAAISLALLIPLLLAPAFCYPVLARLSALARENRQLRQQAREDHLTGLFNRPHLLSMLERELALSQRHEYVVSILLVEIVDFSDLLDRHGRRLSDRLLRLFSERIRDKIRESDLFGRLDGAQFLLVLPHTDYQDTLHMAEGLRALSATIELRDGEEAIDFAIRIGAACTENSGRQLNALLNEADYALYQSRNEHRTQETA
ncbi:GGDEF domain-containing protein [Alloalcanivorax gelatiniphagus]|uniref:diguanylate cyclase n=1 Tax=Alloalcanivorax gelatiniphagus TaxID=1194167 RepID=A0ABY2XPJ4_9GAMM|nr:GGDEF domain-containing protein [Alloalcanivorax gelatiniphagus]TMW14511.1 GGDEF domain-containing protein [Alloalcanivorax gelatiniphagus]